MATAVDARMSPSRSAFRLVRMSPFAASLAAPLAGVVAGLAGQYADFRSLRALILLAVGLGVLATAWAATRHADNVRTIAVAAAIGATAWGGGQVMYVILHIASGEPFDMDMFDAQWEQAIALTMAHAAFLGVPTGLVAGLLLTGWRTFARRRS